MNGETQLWSLQHNVHTPFDLLFLAAGYWTLLSSPAVRLFKQRNSWATEDQTEFLSSVLLVGQLDEIILREQVPALHLPLDTDPHGLY